MGNRILLIDDDEDTVVLLARILQRHDFEVRFVTDPQRALATVSEFLPQAICLDLSLPGTDGYALARSSREQEGMHNLLIIAISGYDADPAKLAAAGISRHFLKPVAIDELIDFLQRGLADQHVP